MDKFQEWAKGDRAIRPKGEEMDRQKGSRRQLTGRNDDENVVGEGVKWHVYPEVKHALDRLIEDYQWRQKLGDEAIAGVDMRHAHNIMGRFLCWLLSLSPEDLDRIQREGEPLFRATEALPVKNMNRELPFPKRHDSVFGPEKDGGYTHGTQGNGRARHKRA